MMVLLLKKAAHMQRAPPGAQILTRLQKANAQPWLRVPK